MGIFNIGSNIATINEHIKSELDSDKGLTELLSQFKDCPILWSWDVEGEGKPSLLWGRRFLISEYPNSTDIGIIDGVDYQSLLNNGKAIVGVDSDTNYWLIREKLYLRDKLSNQHKGIHLVFSYENNIADDPDGPENWWWRIHEIPKAMILINQLKDPDYYYGYNLTFNNNKFHVVGAKYVYIGENRTTDEVGIILGSEGNESSATGESGIKYNNSLWALRYVIGY